MPEHSSPPAVRDPSDPSLPRWARSALLLALVSTLIGLADAGRQILLVQARMPEPNLPTLGEAVAWHLAPWWLWAGLVPLIAWVVRAYPLDRRGAAALAAHGLAGLVVALLYEGLLAVVTIGSSAETTLGAALADSFRTLIAWRLTLDVLTYWAIAGSLHAVGYYGRLRRREIEAAHREAEVARARLAALEARLHPHFLFNALHTVSALVREERGAEAVDTVARLSELLRRVLRLEPGRTIPLDEELEMAELYLEIEETRFADRLSVRRSVDPETLDAGVPPFILQPLIENALRHGLDRHGAGEMRVEAVRRGDDLVLTVADTGPGFADSTSSNGGLGLGVTRERIERMYGGRARLSVGDAPGGGARVELVLPFETARGDGPDGGAGCGATA